MKPRLRDSRRAATALALWCAAACSSPTGSCPEAGSVTGTWSYQATRESPVHASLSGSLVIAVQNCTDFQGSLDVVEVLVTGESRRLAGPVAGTLIDAAVARFEVVAGGVGREHLARLEGDSLFGSWVESSGEAPGSGTFGGRRQ